MNGYLFSTVLKSKFLMPAAYGSYVDNLITGGGPFTTLKYLTDALAKVVTV